MADCLPYKVYPFKLRKKKKDKKRQDKVGNTDIFSKPINNTGSLNLLYIRDVQV